LVVVTAWVGLYFTMPRSPLPFRLKSQDV